MKKSKKWLLSTTLISFLLLLLLGITMYLADPYNYYGNNHGQYLKDKPAFAAAAALRQENYDTAILGSSLSIGIREAYVDRIMDCRSINLSYSGCTAQQRQILIDSLGRTQKADLIICDLLLSNYTDDGNQIINEMQMDAFPEYLFDNNKFNDIKYLYNYDILFKMMPRIVVANTLSLLGKPVSKSYFQAYVDFHADSAWPPKEDWTDAIDRLKFPDTEPVSVRPAFNAETMRQKVDNFLIEPAAANPGQQIIFYFPPYSALYWCEAQENGYLDALLDTREYIAESLAAYENVTIYDFQTLDITLELQYYHDSLHYTEEINEMIIDLISQKKHVLTFYDRTADEEQILSLISLFRSANGI